MTLKVIASDRNGDDRACTTACTSTTEKSVEVTSKPDVDGDFVAAILMIERLPLSDAEKAEAVRRLLSVVSQTE